MSAREVVSINSCRRVFGADDLAVKLIRTLDSSNSIINAQVLKFKL